MSKENSTPLEKLFGSKTRAKLLQLFFENPEKSFYVREMTRVIDEQIHSVRRELLNLENIGVIKNEAFDNKVYYSVNKRHPFCRPLIDLFAKKINTPRDAEPQLSKWEEYCRPVRNYLKAMVLTNRLPGQEGIDLLIIGNDKTKKLTHWAEVVEKKLGKPINYAIMSQDDFTYRKNVRDRFVKEILEMEISEIIDPDGIIR